MIDERARTLVFDFVDGGVVEDSYEQLWEAGVRHDPEPLNDNATANTPSGVPFDPEKMRLGKEDEEGESSWLGTWASRQRTFHHVRPGQDASGQNDGEDGEELAPATFSTSSSFSSKSVNTPYDDIYLQEQAWRYRFARKWQNEQINGLIHAKSATDDDEWLQALKLIEQGQEPRQIPLRESRNDSIMDRLGSFSMLFSNSSHSLATEACMTPTSVGGVGAREESLHTRVLKKCSSKVSTLLAYQKDIEEEAAKRWNAVRNDWLGNHISSVLIDHWGTYIFVLVKMTSYRERGLHKFILRGSNDGTVYDAMQKLRREILHKAEDKDLELANFDIVGTGEFKWMDQMTLSIVCNRAFPDIDDKVRYEDDVVTLAASLLESHGLQSDIKVVI